MKHDDHRTRVGAERRQRMRMRLIESALLVFADKATEDVSIDDVIAVAGVSRGSFYNYFRTEAELAAAVGEEITNELIGQIEARVGHLPNPAERVARGLKLYLGAAARFPLFAGFTSQAGLRAVSPNQLLYEYLPGHIAEAVRSGQMEVPDVSLAVDMIVGAALSAVHALSTRAVHRHYAENAVMHILVGLGVTRATARKLAFAPVDPIEPPADSLLARARPAPAVASRGASSRARQGPKGPA